MIVYWISPRRKLEVKHVWPIHDMYMSWVRLTTGNILAYYEDASL
jgi:hypothetical protein